MAETSTWALFPILPLKDGHCSCSLGADCPRAGKHPAVSWGDYEPGMHDVREGHGVGVRTGQEFGIFVIDADDKRATGGPNGLANALALGEWPRTYEVTTPRPGLHRYYRWPSGVDYLKSSSDLLAPGVDVRASGGFVAGEGSAHKSGGVYEAHDGTTFADIVDAPQWLVDAVLATGSSHEGQSSDVTPIDVETPDGLARVQAGIDFAKRCAPSIEGQNGSGPALVAAMHLTRGLELPQDVSLAVLLEHFNPRCSPPWSEDDLERKVQQAATVGTMAPGSRAPLPVAFEEMLAAHVKPKPKLAPKPAKTRKQPSPDHEYSFSIGDISTGDKSPMTLSDVINHLVSRPEWCGVFQFNEFSQKIFAVDPPMKLDLETGELTRSDITMIRTWFEKELAASVSFETMKDAIDAAARVQTFHPVREYLESLSPVAEPRLLDTLASRLYGDKTPIAQVCLRKFLVAAVRRILTPGEKVDTMLVLVGGQGVRKSTSSRVLFGGKAWFRDQMPALDTKEASQALLGHWCVELAELEKVLRAENSTTKAYLSRDVDKFRMPYAPGEIALPRQCVFIGTTNERNFLRDPTGARRYLPITVGTDDIDLQWLSANRDRIWAEALEIARRPYALTDPPEDWHWLTREEELEMSVTREAFTQEDAWNEAVLEYCSGKTIVRPEQIYVEAIASSDEGSLAKASRREMDRIRDVLETAGCTYGVQYDRETKKSVRGYKVSDAVRLAPLSSREARRRASAGAAAVGATLAALRPTPRPS